MQHNDISIRSIGIGNLTAANLGEAGEGQVLTERERDICSESNVANLSAASEGYNMD